MIRTLTAVFLSLFLGACSKAPPMADDVARRVERAVARPTYFTEQGAFAAGTSFVLKLSSRHVLVTAQHVFGPDGGLNQQVAWDDLSSFVKGVAVVSMVQPTAELHTSTVLPIRGARPFGSDAYDSDVAAFPLEDAGAFTAIEPAAAPPQDGAPVYLVAQITGSPALVHPARVVANSGPLQVVYNEDLNLSATSGAPIVDSSGRLVGINVAGGWYFGRTTSRAVRATAVVARLRAALSESATGNGAARVPITPAEAAATP